MKLNKNILAFDLIVQSILIGAALISVVTSIVFPSYLLFTLMLGFAIGFWQVLSASIIAIFARNKKRLQYLLAVVAFFANATIVSYFWKDYVFESEFIMVIVWAIVPTAYAFWYYKITQDDISNNEKNRNSSESVFKEKEFV